MGSQTENSATRAGGAKAAWALLGVAGILAVGSIAYNVMSTPDAAATQTAAPGAPPSIAELRDAAEGSSGQAGPWADLALAHFERGEYGDAADAYKKAVAIDDDAAILWSALGESLTYANDASAPDADPLPPEAIAAFEKAYALDSSDPRARYFLAVRKDLAGDHEGAITDWLTLLSESPVGAPWESDLVGTIQQVGKINNIDVADRLAKANEGRLPPIAVPGSGAVAGQAAADNVRGPTQEQIDQVSQMAPEDQQAQIESMVAMAEQRLKDDPTNLNRWVMVMRSHVNLGNPAKAKATLEAAVAANPAEEEALRDQARALGIR